MKWFFVENIILKFKLKNIKTLLNKRKTWKIEKRLILKKRIIININEILILFKKIKIII